MKGVGNSLFKKILTHLKLILDKLLLSLQF